MLADARIASVADPGAFIRLKPKDFRLAKKTAEAAGMPLTIWLRVVIMERLEKEREHGK